MSFSETLDQDNAVGRKTEAVAPDHVEAQLQTKVEDTGLMYDVHGMLLIPQPTDRSDDPLVLNNIACRLTRDMGKAP